MGEKELTQRADKISAQPLLRLFPAVILFHFDFIRYKLLTAENGRKGVNAESK